jgi:hypothetical protein
LQDLSRVHTSLHRCGKLLGESGCCRPFQAFSEATGVDNRPPATLVYTAVFAASKTALFTALSTLSSL